MSKTAYVFVGQGAQKTGMGLELYQNFEQAKAIFHQADEILGFELSKIMFKGTDEQLKQTKVTQPAIFTYCVAKMLCLSKTNPSAVAGHSLGEFTALVACKAIEFEDALKLVQARALAMQKACEENPSTMAAILGLEDGIIEQTCKNIDQIVVAANYNCNGQVVISGTHKGIDQACEELLSKGAKRALKLNVSGAFHSPLMLGAKQSLEAQIKQTVFKDPICEIYQNVDAKANSNAKSIQKNLIDQLTSAVKWKQSIENMIAQDITNFTEIGPSKVLSGMIKKIDRQVTTTQLEIH